MEKKCSRAAGGVAAAVAFEDLMRGHRDKVWGFLLKLTRDASMADDLCQEVFIRAFKTYGSLERAESARSWLYSIAYHVTVDWMRRRAAERRLVASLENEGRGALSWARPERRLVREEEACFARKQVEALWGAVETLAPMYRDAMRLRYREGRSLSAIAAITGAPLTNVKVRLHRARKILAKRLACAPGRSDRPCNREGGARI